MPWGRIKRLGIKKGVLLPSVLVQAFILPEGKKESISYYEPDAWGVI